MRIGEADFTMTEQAFAEGVFDKGSDKLFVQFFMHPKLNQTKSKESNRPIYEDREYIRIITPGDKDNIIERPATEIDFRRFPRQYEAFKRGQSDQITSGTPLKMVPWVSRAQCEELAFFHVYTVEQLAEISDSNAQNFMGIQSLKQQAKDFLAAAQNTGFATQLREQLTLQNMENEQLKNQIRQLNARLEAVEASKAG